ncbi:hypothetical protein LB565_18575 [Mesorhizobium sp. CA14]|uniref:hypothetical protein n=1 Tax=Mesorhizobium sp. CA14 TaxID=2876642 RepID=UPI001CCCB3D3|nr:hypothetical protein [Mesorhizobium sp. CA14]MBZ9849993.1 hypothetical protein [Mesorhizobium sp. CA14]
MLQIGDRRHPIRRAAFKLASGMHSKWMGHHSLTNDIFSLLPPKNDLWATRLNWHFEGLIRLWKAALLADETISIFDQGMVQFVCSLVLFSGITDPERVSRALALIPKPNLLVRLQAPREILEVRLRERQHTLGILQKLLELDMKRSLDQIEHVNLVEELLESSGVPISSHESLDAVGRAAAVETIVKDTIERTRRTPHRPYNLDPNYHKLGTIVR